MLPAFSIDSGLKMHLNLSPNILGRQKNVVPLKKESQQIRDKKQAGLLFYLLLDRTTTRQKMRRVQIQIEKEKRNSCEITLQDK